MYTLKYPYDVNLSDTNYRYLTLEHSSTRNPAIMTNTSKGSNDQEI